MKLKANWVLCSFFSFKHITIKLLLNKQYNIISINNKGLSIHSYCTPIQVTTKYVYEWSVTIAIAKSAIAKSLHVKSQNNLT